MSQVGAGAAQGAQVGAGTGAEQVSQVGAGAAQGAQGVGAAHVTQGAHAARFFKPLNNSQGFAQQTSQVAQGAASEQLEQDCAFAFIPIIIMTARPIIKIRDFIGQTLLFLLLLNAFDPFPPGPPLILTSNPFPAMTDGIY